MQQMYLGHRIHFNWPLLIIMAWATLIVYTAMTNQTQECEIPVESNVIERGNQ